MDVALISPIFHIFDGLFRNFSLFVFAFVSLGVFSLLQFLYIYALRVSSEGLKKRSPLKIAKKKKDGPIPIHENHLAEVVGICQDVVIRQNCCKSVANFEKFLFDLLGEKVIMEIVAAAKKKEDRRVDPLWGDLQRTVQRGQVLDVEYLSSQNIAYVPLQFLRNPLCTLHIRKIHQCLLHSLLLNMDVRSQIVIEKIDKESLSGGMIDPEQSLGNQQKRPNFSLLDPDDYTRDLYRNYLCV